MKLVDIVLCDVSVDSSTRHWDQQWLNQMMSYTNPNRRGMSNIFIALSTNIFYTIINLFLPIQTASPLS